MNKPNFYDEVVAMDPDAKILPVGAYVCEIKSAVEERSQSSGNPMLVFMLDISEGEYKDYFTEKYKANTKENKKWGAILRIVLDAINAGEETKKIIARRVKGNINAIENSNNFVFDWKDPKALVGKFVGCEFGLKEFLKTDGSTGTIVEPVRFRNIETVREGNIKQPRVRLLDNSYMDYDDYMELRKGKNNPQEKDAEFVVIDDNDLPF